MGVTWTNLVTVGVSFVEHRMALSQQLCPGMLAKGPLPLTDPPMGRCSRLDITTLNPSQILGKTSTELHGLAERSISIQQTIVVVEEQNLLVRIDLTWYFVTSHLTPKQKQGYGETSNNPRLFQSRKKKKRCTGRD